MLYKLKENRDKLFVLIVLSISGLSLLLIPLDNGDEFWNYSFAKNICAGMSPYSDFSIVQTPLSAYIMAIFLLLFGDSLIVYRIVGIILFVGVFYLLYLVCVMLSKSRMLAFCAIAFSCALIYFTWIYNYNQLILFIIFSIMYIFIKKKDKSQQFYLSVGISVLYGITPLIKQSTGSILLVFYWSFLMFLVLRRFENIKRVLIHIGVSTLPVILYLVFLIVKGDFWYFVDYAVVGVKTFTHRTWLLSLMKSHFIFFIIGLFPFAIIIISFISMKRKTVNIDVISHLYLLGLAIAAGVVAFPLSDYYHYMIAVVGYIPCLFCCIKFKEYKVSQITVCIVVAGAVLMSVVFSTIDKADQYKKCKLNHYEGLLIDGTLEESIITIEDYILNEEQEGFNVIIASTLASACMQPLDKYNKDFDMLLVGNLGTKSVEELLTQNENAIYLVPRDEESMSMQEHFELVHYIKDNYEKIDEVLMFDVYRPKE